MGRENINEKEGIFHEVYKGIEGLKDMDEDNEDMEEGGGLFPKFSFAELSLGKLLGTGGFCTVHEIGEFDLVSEDVDYDKKAMSASSNFSDLESIRKIMAGKSRRNGDARYAIKKLRRDLVGIERTKGIIDLAIEARFLTTICHTNIIRARGLAVVEPVSEGFFIILDRLYDTLELRLKQWSLEAGKLTGCCGFFKNHDKIDELWKMRFAAMYDMSSAMTFLHDKKVIYRDLKPENMGFDVRGDIKLFDFGLAKELSPDYKRTDTYKMTGCTGSLRYMAPEVARREPYNLSADVYSFGILFWQVCSLEIPFAGYSVATHRQSVANGTSRPRIDNQWPLSWTNLMTKCWDSNILERPSFRNVHDNLGEECLKLSIDPDEEATTRRASSMAHPKMKQKGILQVSVQTRKSKENLMLDTDTRKM